ncbi:MAG: hypothetical protein A2V66_18240 [Ignavibacteria bacterium RBG_13_36_8]|nr:MAG: hypothetical protein A2V66_18240 [Ignavibacteria bacterium RBG_13_36_8]
MNRLFHISIFILISLSLLIQVNLSAQVTTKFIIFGKVTDTDTGKPIENVNIYLAYSSVVTTTNNNGLFNIKNLLPGTYHLIISHIGYEIQTIKVRLAERTEEGLSIKLSPKLYQLPAVIVE